MASIHRMQWIDESIRQHTYPNINKIIERYEISRRQALRDIEYLRDSLGAPIQYSKKHKGYYYTHDSFSVPTQLMTEEHKQLLACLSTHYEVLAKHNSRSSETFQALAELLTRLSGSNTSILDEKLFSRHGIIPFHAILQHQKQTAYPIPESLKPFYRGKNELKQDIFEFYDSHEFIPALLAAGFSYRIIHPNWLKDKMVAHMEYLKKVSIG